jgi:hypothetical protein
VIDATTLVRVVDDNEEDGDGDNDNLWYDGWENDEVVRRLRRRRQMGRYLVGTAAVTSSQDVTASLDAYYYQAQQERTDDKNDDDDHNPMLVMETDESSPTSDALRLIRTATCPKTDLLHVVRYGTLRALYGVYAADYGLAASIHATALACAVRNQSVTIVLFDFNINDDDDNNAGHDDNDDDQQRRLRQYLDRLLEGLKRHRTIVYPEHPLYGGGGSGDSGVRLAVRMNLVAIVPTGRSSAATPTQQRRRQLFGHDVDYLAVPKLTTVEARRRGLQHILADVVVVEGGDPALFWRRLAENCPWLTGYSILTRIRHRVHAAVGNTTPHRLSMAALEAILGEFGPVISSQLVDDDDESSFRPGGNELARQALEDAMNPQVELESLGLSAPTGILLYGPPGTGTCSLLLWRGKNCSTHIVFYCGETLQSNNGSVHQNAVYFSLFFLSLMQGKHSWPSPCHNP